MQIQIQRTEKKPKEVKPQKTKVKKEKRIPVIKLGVRRKMTIGLWVLMVCSLSFAIYKNFTAVSTHTVHEREVIEMKIADTNKIENFVRDFAKVYYTWENSKESIDQRKANLAKYLTGELQSLNADTVRMDIPTSSAVKDVQIWDIQKLDDSEKDYAVLFSVKQTITEGEASQNVTSSFQVIVHEDDIGDMVITKTPTIHKIPEKSGHTPKAIENDDSIGTDTSKELTDFLTAFFTLYPKADEKELSYYVRNQVLEPVDTEYVFAELLSPVFTQKDEQIQVFVSVAYLDDKMKMTQISQFSLVVEKGDNWMIVE